MGIACLAINISYVGFDLAKYIVEIFKNWVMSEGNEVRVVSELNFVEYWMFELGLIIKVKFLRLTSA